MVVKCNRTNYQGPWYRVQTMDFSQNSAVFKLFSNYVFYEKFGSVTNKNTNE